jgi:hypothetical protein
MITDEEYFRSLKNVREYLKQTNIEINAVSENAMLTSDLLGEYRYKYKSKITAGVVHWLMRLDRKGVELVSDITPEKIRRVAYSMHTRITPPMIEKIMKIKNEFTNNG